MPKATKGGFYAVQKGRHPGVYENWQECQREVEGFTESRHQKFENRSDAEAFVASGKVPEKPLIPQHSPSKQRKVSPDVGDERIYDVVYCRGTCKGNGTPDAAAGIGLWWGPGDRRNIAERCPGDQTNNRAETLAIIKVLETASNLGKPLLIKSDSTYATSNINKYMDGWSDNGYRIPSMKRVINATLFRYFGALRDARKSASQDIIVQNTSDLETCQGHEGAKRLSEEGSKKPVLPDRDWEELIRHCSTVRPIMADASNAAVAGPSTSASQHPVI